MVLNTDLLIFFIDLFTIALALYGYSSSSYMVELFNLMLTFIVLLPYGITSSIIIIQRFTTTTIIINSFMFTWSTLQYQKSRRK